MLNSLEAGKLKFMRRGAAPLQCRRR